MFKADRKERRALGALEVGLRVVPGLNEAVPQGVRGGHVSLLVIKLVAAPRHRVLHMVHDALLDAQHIVLDVRVCI